MSIFSGDIASKRTETRANTKLKRYDPHRLRTTIIQRKKKRDHI